MHLDWRLCSVDIVSYISTLVSSDAMIAEHSINIAHADLSLILTLVELLSIWANSATVTAWALVHVNGQIVSWCVLKQSVSNSGILFSQTLVLARKLVGDLAGCRCRILLLVHTLLVAEKSYLASLKLIISLC